MTITYLLVGIGAVIAVVALMWIRRKNSTTETFTSNVDSNGQTKVPVARNSFSIAPGMQKKPCARCWMPVTRSKPLNSCANGKTSASRKPRITSISSQKAGRNRRASEWSHGL